MSESRTEAGLIDVLDRVVDKGIVIDAHVRVALVGVELVAIEARVVVASIETYLRHAETLSYTGLAARPSPDPAPGGAIAGAAGGVASGSVPPLIVEAVVPDGPALPAAHASEKLPADAVPVVPPQPEPEG